LGWLLEDVPKQHHHQTHQEHRQAELIDEVHGLHVEVGFPARVFAAEVVTEDGAEIEKVFTVHVRAGLGSER
jgi:hypothetical protein